MRQLVIASLTAAASQVGARRHGADQAGEHGFPFRGVQVQLGGGAAEGMVGALQPAIHPGGGLERFAAARLAQQELHLLDQTVADGPMGGRLRGVRRWGSRARLGGGVTDGRHRPSMAWIRGGS